MGDDLGITFKAQADLESKNESTERDSESCLALEADDRKR